MITSLFSSNVKKFPLFNISRGYKIKSHVYRRCKACYFEYRENRLYVECKVHNRHRLAQFIHKNNKIRDFDWLTRQWYVANCYHKRKIGQPPFHGGIITQ